MNNSIITEKQEKKQMKLMIIFVCCFQCVFTTIQLSVAHNKTLKRIQTENEQHPLCVLSAECLRSDETGNN